MRRKACKRCGMLRRAAREEQGQMTVELLVVLPVVLAIALIAVNALTFFGQCAAFDRASREVVRAQAASPAYGQTVADSAGLVQAELAAAFPEENLQVEVSVEQDVLGHVRFTCTLACRPTLFGLGMRDSLLGVPAPAMVHRKAIVLDVYKPGMLF